MASLCSKTLKIVPNDKSLENKFFIYIKNNIVNNRVESLS